MATLRQIIEGILKNRIASPERAFATQLVAAESGDLAATIQGSGTAGTYETQTNACRYTRIGRRVWLDVWIQFAAVITGGGTGNLQITGVPYAKAASVFSIGTCRLSGIDWAAGANLSIGFISAGASSVLAILETNDNAASTFVQISGIAALDQLFGSICYETDDA